MDLITLIIGGREVKVTPAQGVKLLEAMEKGKPTYYSHSKSETFIIEDMATSHIKNALSKKARSYYERISKIVDLEEYLNAFVAFAKEDEVQWLYNELIKRVDED